MKMTKFDWLLLAGALALIAVFGYALRAHGQNALGYAHLGYANVGASVAGGGACNTAQTNMPAQSGAASLGLSPTNGTDNQVYMGTWFVPQFTTNVCRADVKLMARDNDSTGPAAATFLIKVGVFTDNSDEPGTLVGSWSDWVSASTISSNMAYVTFTMSVSVVSGTKYWFVITSDGIRNAGDVAAIAQNNDVAANKCKGANYGPSAWTLINTYNNHVYNLYSSP